MKIKEWIKEYGTLIALMLIVIVSVRIVIYAFIEYEGDLIMNPPLFVLMVFSFIAMFFLPLLYVDAMNIDDEWIRKQKP